MTRPAALTQTEYDATNEQIRFNSATTNLVYDNNGNLTSFTDGSGTTTYTWNARNQLTTISGPGLTASFIYDGLGRRKSKTVNSTTTGFWYDGNDVLAELSGSTPTATYVRSLATDEPFIRKGASDEFYQSDALGSALALTDSAGASQTSYTYEPFGKTSVSGASANPFQFTGRENDGTGIYSYRARYYDPRAQRFLSEDPVGLLGGSANFYAYLANRPLRFVDPLGLFNILAGGGFSGVGVTGVEASSGFFANPGFFGQNADIGTFASVGVGTGLNISADFFVGYIKGGPENVKGETFNTNITAGLWSITVFKDPKTGEIIGGTLGFGPGATPVGLSETYSITRTLTVRDLLCAIFSYCGSGDVLYGRK